MIIAGAGMSAALPGAVAAYTELPVIGVPLTSSKSAAGGLDAILAIVQMPPGVPVACVSLNGARNAAILAAKILAQGGGYPAGARPPARLLKAPNATGPRRARRGLFEGGFLVVVSAAGAGVAPVVVATAVAEPEWSSLSSSRRRSRGPNCRRPSRQRCPGPSCPRPRLILRVPRA